MVSELKRAALPAVIGLIGVAVYTLLQVTAPQPAPQLEAPRPIRVKVEPAIRTLTRPNVVAFGEVRAAVRTELVAQVGGKVVATSPAFIEGGNFTPDDVLLSIEDTDYRAAMEEGLARVAAAKLELEQALADADVARKQLAAQEEHTRQLKETSERLTKELERMRQVHAHGDQGPLHAGSGARSRTEVAGALLPRLPLSAREAAVARQPDGGHHLKPSPPTCQRVLRHHATVGGVGQQRLATDGGKIKGLSAKPKQLMAAYLAPLPGRNTCNSARF